MDRFLRVEIAYHKEDNRLDEPRYYQDAVIDSCVVECKGVSDEDRNFEKYDQEENHCFDFKKQNFASLSPPSFLNMPDKH